MHEPKEAVFRLGARRVPMNDLNEIRFHQAQITANDETVYSIHNNFYCEQALASLIPNIFDGD